MRYLLHKMLRSELSLRKQYLYDVFNLWFFKTGELGFFDVLESFPFVNNDIMLIYGHNFEIVSLFDNFKEELKEENIAIISCESRVPNGYSLKDKNIYLAPQRKNSAPVLLGKDYGFEFNVTDAELRLYNSKINDPLQKISNIFNKIQ